MVPTKLCSSSCRLLESSVTPARTLGLAAASTTQSTLGSRSKSLGQRTSPCKTRTPAVFSCERFCSPPARRKLSMPETSTLESNSRNVRASVLPVKPQIPAISIFIQLKSARGSSGPPSRYSWSNTKHYVIAQVAVVKNFPIVAYKALTEIVNLDQSIPCCAVSSAHDRGICPCGQVKHNCRFERIGRSESVLLYIDPVNIVVPVVVGDDR